MAVDTITIEEREFPSDRLIRERTDTFDIGEPGDPNLGPYRLTLSLFVTDLDVGVEMPAARASGPLPAPWGPGPSQDLTFYSYLFTIWPEDWMSDRQRDFADIYPRVFKAYYLPMDSRVAADTVYLHAVSLQSLRVLESSPDTGFPDGVVSTIKLDREVRASPLLRGRQPSEEPEFVEWMAWTNPATAIPPPRGVQPRVRLTLERSTTGRAVAFYKRHPHPPGSEDPPVEKPRLGLPFEERIRRVGARRSRLRPRDA